MAERDPQELTDPHERPWFFRMLGWYGLTSHPQHDDAFDDEDDEDANTDLQGKTLRGRFSKFFNFPDARAERYRIFDQMDQFHWVQEVMDVYAEEVTQKDYDRQVAVWVESKHKHMIDGANTCFDNVMLNDRLYAMARQAALKGDVFWRNIYQTGKGILGWRFTNPAQVSREVDKYDRLVGFKQGGNKFRGQSKHETSWPWDYVHCRLLGRDLESQYGSSAGAILFRPWRQLTLYEDGLLLYHVRRSPDRNIIFVNTGDLEDDEAFSFVNRVKKRFRRSELVDPASPKYLTQFAPLSPWEDLFWPVRGSEDVSRVEKLEGSGPLGDPSYIEHFRNAFFGAAKVPKAYFGFEGDINAKATLSQQDVRFARTMKRLQAALIYAIRNLLDIHFMLFDPDPASINSKFNIDTNPYAVMMSPISYLDEWERLELLTMRSQIVEGMGGLAQIMGLNPQAWAIYVLTHYAKLPEETVLKLVQKADSGQPPAQAAFQEASEGVNGNPKRRSRRGLRTMVEQKFGPLNGNRWGRWQDGYTQLDENEKRTINQQFSTNDALRQLVGGIAYYHDGDEVIRQAGSRQTDRSTLPPRTLDDKPIYLADDIPQSNETGLLVEHLKQSQRQQPTSPDAPSDVVDVEDMDIEYAGATQ